MREQGEYPAFLSALLFAKLVYVQQALHVAPDLLTGDGLGDVIGGVDKIEGYATMWKGWICLKIRAG